MQDIAREAGVAKSLLHYHFRSKEEIFLEVQLCLMRGILEQVRIATDGTKGSFRHLQAALDAVMEDLEKDLDRVRTFFEFRHVGNSAFEERVRVFYEDLESLIVEGIENTLGNAVEHLRISPKRVARQFRAFYQGLLIDLAFVRTEEERSQVKATFKDYQMLMGEALFEELV
jgi:AcrR family transcriptional regulator